MCLNWFCPLRLPMFRCVRTLRSSSARMLKKRNNQRNEPMTCNDLPVRFLQKPTNHFVAPHLNPHERSTHRPLMKTTSTLLTTLVLAIGGLTAFAQQPAPPGASAAMDYQVYRGTQVPPEVERLYEKGLKFLVSVQ